MRRAVWKGNTGIDDRYAEGLDKIRPKSLGIVKARRKTETSYVGLALPELRRASIAFLGTQSLLVGRSGSGKRSSGGIIMDGLQVQQANDDHRDFSIIRAQCVVAEFLAGDEASSELTAREFETILVGIYELRR